MNADLLSRARELLSAYTDAEIFASRTHTTPDEGEIQKRLDAVINTLCREFGSGTIASSSVVAVLRERRANAS